MIGFGAMALVGSETIAAAPGGENSAAPLLAFRIGGAVLLGIVSAVAFATILAVVAGLTLAASASFAHDVYANVIKRGNAEPRREIRVARLTAIVVGILSIFGGIAGHGQNVAFLVSLALALAASANLSTILYTIFWRRFNTTGTLWSIYGGLGSCLVLIIFSPVMSGTKTAIFPDVDFAWFPLGNPGLVSIPFSFLCGFLATIFSKPDHDIQPAQVRTLPKITPVQDIAKIRHQLPDLGARLTQKSSKLLRDIEFHRNLTAIRPPTRSRSTDSIHSPNHIPPSRNHQEVRLFSDRRSASTWYLYSS